jgi:uncharacterized protein
MEATQKIEAVAAVLDTFEEAAVAVSGGIDSLTLAMLAADRLGPRVQMFHSLTASVPQEATARTRALASERGWTLHVVDAREFARAEYVANPVNRCFYCKQSLYAEIARHTKVTVLSGANTDDLRDFRPGLDAAREAGARHPFVEAGVDKPTIRAIARELGLGDLAEIPASPCLSSRVETGIAIAVPTLRKIEAAENAVRVFVPSTAAVRCRVRAQGIVVEIEEEVLERLGSTARGWIVEQVGAIFGGRRPTLEAYRMGSAFVR